jgi:hypothetical protein
VIEASASSHDSDADFYMRPVSKRAECWAGATALAERVDTLSIKPQLRLCIPDVVAAFFTFERQAAIPGMPIAVLVGAAVGAALFIGG